MLLLHVATYIKPEPEISAMANSNKPAPTVILSTAAITMPTAAERAKTRKPGGNKTLYDVASLAVGKSLAIIGRTAKELSTTISSANRNDKLTDQVPKKDEAGKVMIGDDKKPIMETRQRKFFAVDCDPATDPDKATARIWREV
jgi:hypothetical protein